MLQTVEAEIDIYGNVRLLEPLRVTKPTRALLTLLEDTTAPAEDQGNGAELLKLLQSPEFANRRSYPVRPGSFMKIVQTDRCERLRELLLVAASRHDRPARKPARGMPPLPRASRYLALQALQPPALEM